MRSETLRQVHHYHFARELCTVSIGQSAVLVKDNLCSQVNILMGFAGECCFQKNQGYSCLRLSVLLVSLPGHAIACLEVALVVVDLQLLYFYMDVLIARSHLGIFLLLRGFQVAQLCYCLYWVLSCTATSNMCTLLVVRRLTFDRTLFLASRLT